MIRSVYAVVCTGWGFGDSIDRGRLYTTEKQAQEHCSNQHGSLRQAVQKFTLLENDEDVNRLEAAENAARRLQDLREEEVKREVEAYRNDMLEGRKR